MDFKAVALEYLDSDTGLVVISIVLMLVLALPILFTIAHACRAGGVFSRLWHVALFGWYIAFTMLDTVTTAIWTTRFLADASAAFCAQTDQTISAPLDLGRNADRDAFVGALAICFLVVGTCFTFWYSCRAWVRLCERNRSLELPSRHTVSLEVSASMGCAANTPGQSILVALGVTGTLAWVATEAYTQPRRFAGCDETERTDWVTWLPQMLMAGVALSALLATILLFKHGIAYPASSAHPDPPRSPAGLHVGMGRVIWAPCAWLRVCNGGGDHDRSSGHSFVPLFAATLCFFCTWPLALAYVLLALVGYFAIMLSLAAMLSTGEVALEIMTHLGIAEPATRDAGRVDAQKRRERTHYRLLLIWIITDVLPLLVLQLYGMFWSSVPRPHSTFALLSLATSVYMDTLPFVFVIVWGMSAMDVVALNWPKSKQR